MKCTQYIVLEQHGDKWHPALLRDAALSARDSEGAALDLLDHVRRLQPVPRPLRVGKWQQDVLTEQPAAPVRYQHAYIAHPYGGSPENLDRAATWVCWLAEKYTIVPSANWIIICSGWTEDRRELGLHLDCLAIERCDLVFQVGSNVSDGMGREGRHATGKDLSVLNLTGYVEPPTWPEWQQHVKRRGYDLSRLERRP